MASNDALHIISSERSKLWKYARSDELMTVSQLHRAPAYSRDPVAVTLEHCHLGANGHLIGVGLFHSRHPPYAHSHVIRT